MKEGLNDLDGARLLNIRVRKAQGDMDPVPAYLQVGRCRKWP